MKNSFETSLILCMCTMYVCCILFVFIEQNMFKPHKSVIALSTLLSTPIESVLVDLLFKLTIDLIDDIDLDKRSHIRWIYVCVLIRFNH